MAERDINPMVEAAAEFDRMFEKAQASTYEDLFDLLEFTGTQRAQVQHLVDQAMVKFASVARDLKSPKEFMQAVAEFWMFGVLLGGRLRDKKLI